MVDVDTASDREIALHVTTHMNQGRIDAVDELEDRGEDHRHDGRLDLDGLDLASDFWVTFLRGC